MPLQDPRHVLRRHFRIPDVIGEDEHYRSFVVTPGTGVAEYHFRGEAPPPDFAPKKLQQLIAAFFTAASLARCGADKDLA